LEQKKLANAPLRIGALSTLSRNFQIKMLEPLLGNDSVRMVLKSGDTELLYQQLSTLAIDMVLTTEPPVPQSGSVLKARLLDRQPVALIGSPEWIIGRGLKQILEDVPLIVPTDRAIRPLFDGLLARLNVTPSIAAEVDDMAMIRLLARENAGVAVAPAVVFADEIASGRLATAPFPLDISEPFYAVTKKRDIPHPGLASLLSVTGD